MTTHPSEHHPQAPEIDGQVVYRQTDGPEGRVLAVVGELDLATAGDLRRELDTLIADAGPHVYLDLAGVTFFDSSSVAVLIEANQCAGSRGVLLTIDRPSTPCRLVFELLGLAEVLEIRDGAAG
jgi:anti-anti-sigma factor